MKILKLFGSIVLFLCLCNLESVSVSCEKNVTKLDDVIWDVQYLCFESLNLNDLFSLAKTNQHFSVLAKEIFNRKHSKKTVRVVHPERNGISRIIDLSTLIILRSYESTVDLLKLYGHLIKRLELAFPYDKKENTTEISHLLNSHCADTLIEFKIDIRAYHGHFFEDMTKPFKQLETFSIEGSVEGLGSSTFSFNELFPVLNHFTCKSLVIANKSCIDAHFEHLEHFDVWVDRLGTVNEFTSEDVGKCLKKNPQLRSLILHNAKRPLLELASKTLPHIIDLELSCCENHVSDEDQEIIFESVANLTMSSISEQFQRNITFRNLTEFHTYMNIDRAPAIIQFVQKYPHLKRLFINSFIHTEDFQRLMNARLNIEEISMKLMNVAEELTFNFIRNSQHMRKINFNNDVCHKIDEAKLHDEFSDKWIITSGQETIWLTRRG